MDEGTAPVDDLLCELATLDPPRLLALAARAPELPEPPAFHGRCLEPAYLAAVADGTWNPVDEERLAHAVSRAEASALPRVPWRHRRRLRHALRATVVSVSTQDLPVPGWQERNRGLASAWEAVVGPIPAQRAVSA